MVKRSAVACYLPTVESERRQYIAQFTGYQRIKRNAIPLFGKTISNTLKKRIVEKGVKDIYICLDLDARKQALEAAEYFISNGVNVYFVDLTDKDPSKLGFLKIKELIDLTPQLTANKLIEEKILCLL